MNEACKIFKEKIEEIDKQLLFNRNKQLYKLDGKRKTKLKTIMGVVEIERRIYLYDDGECKKYVFLLDKYLELFRNNRRYSTTVIDIVKYMRKEEGKSTREISKYLGDNNVQMSQQTVWEIVNKNI